MQSPNPEDCAIDPDFDHGFGGFLTLAQIADPVAGAWQETSFEPARDGADYRAHMTWRRERLAWLVTWEDASSRAHYMRWKLKQVRARWDKVFPRAKAKITPLRARFSRAANRFDYAVRNHMRGINPRCNDCFPYNWRHTPDYWGDDSFHWRNEAELERHHKWQ